MSELSAEQKAAIIMRLVAFGKDLEQGQRALRGGVDSLSGLLQGPAAEGLAAMRDDDPLGLHILSVGEKAEVALQAVFEVFGPLNDALRLLSQDAEAVALYQEQSGTELKIEELPGVM